MNKWIDLTILIDEFILPFPGDEKPRFEVVKTLERDGYNMKKITTGMHMGTHIDAKSHVTDSPLGIDTIPINKLIGKAVVLKPEIIDNIIQTQSIDESKLQDVTILILNLNHSYKLNTEAYYNYPKFQKDFVNILIRNNISVIAMDIPSPEYYKGDFLTMHKHLIENDITIIENLTNLNQLETFVEFIALPLKIKNMDGSMARCVARNL